MRISLDSPALIAVRNWLAGSQSTQRGRSGSRMASRPTFRAEQLEPRTMLDAGMRAFLPDLADESDTGSSTVDNLTYDRTPILSGSVQGAASQVRVRIDGVRVATVPVTNGKWTYTVPAEQALDAVLLDLNMPGASGLEVAKVIKIARPDLKVLMLSGNLPSDVRAELQNLGIEDFVQKPYALDDVGRRLRALLDQIT